MGGGWRRLDRSRLAMEMSSIPNRYATLLVLVELATRVPQGRCARRERRTTARPAIACFMRAPVDTIAAPLFPTRLPWVNATGPQASIPAGQADAGRVLGLLPAKLDAHAAVREGVARALRPPGCARSACTRPASTSPGERAVRAAVARLEISYPVLIDSAFEVWEDYGNEGWPARYLFDGRARLFEYHFGEGGYDETELAIQSCSASSASRLRRCAPRTPGRWRQRRAEEPGAYSGPYEAGGVWAVLDGVGTVRVRTVATGDEASSCRSRIRAPTRCSSTSATRRPLSSRSGRGWSAWRRASPRAWSEQRVRRAGVRRLRQTPAFARRGVSSACVRSGSSCFSRGGPESSTSTHVPGQ